MPLCKYCKKRIKWVSVAEETSTGASYEKRIPVNPKTKERHRCIKQADPRPHTVLKKPWWID